jgi:hypothetical protein
MHGRYPFKMVEHVRPRSGDLFRAQAIDPANKSFRRVRLQEIRQQIIDGDPRSDDFGAASSIMNDVDGHNWAPKSSCFPP